MAGPQVRPYLDAADAAPYFDVQAVTPNDGTDLPGGTCRGFTVTVAGTLKFTPANQGAAATFVTLTLLAGVVYNIRATRIWTASTATGIFALY
jgi:hypothetical protein